MTPGATVRPTLRERLSAEASRLGFQACRIARPDAIPEAGDRLRAWLADGAHGEMDWMQDTAARRADPRALWPEVRSVVMLATNYGPTADPRAVLAETTRGAVSVYAQHRDYHEVIKGKLKHLAGWLVREARPLLPEVKVFVDTAPVMEKPLAAASGLGWQGKHTNLVSRDFGSWLFLGSVFTTLELAPDPGSADHCGSCRACLEVCPTDAFPAPYRLDARRCISYLTIEHAGPIPHAFRAPIGNRIYGCDDCLAVCPWNKFAQAGREAKLAAPPGRDAPGLAELAGLDEAGFRARFAGSPIKRIGLARFLRNVLIAVGNSGDPTLADAALARLADPSAIVRGAAIWAVRRLLGPGWLAQAAERRRQETDPDVRAEWEAAAS